MNFIKTALTETVNQLRSQLYLTLTSPIDAMWEQLYISASQHYLIENEGKTIGFCCINENNFLLQLFLLEEHLCFMNQVVTKLIKSKLITGASLSSSEPISFNKCLSLSESIKTNTLCFEHTNTPINVDTILKIEPVTSNDIPAVKTFLLEQVNMNDTFGYTENLVSRKEIFMFKKSNTIIATSECRLSESQPHIADLGIIVNSNFRDKGIASQVMQLQVNRVLALGRKPICSTTLDNLPAQKAIKNAGFYCSNIIFDMNF